MDNYLNQYYWKHILKKTLILFAFTASMLVSFLAQATDTAELSVKGVIRPTACAPSLSGGGLVNYGLIESTHLSANQATALEPKTVSFTMTCSAPARVALRLIDNRSDSIVPGLVNHLVGEFIPYTKAYGLGAADGTNIGAYVVELDLNSFSGTAVEGGENMHAEPLTGTSSQWLQGSFMKYFGTDPYSRLKAFKSSSGTGPGAWSSLAGNLIVSPIIDQRSKLPLTEEINLDGSATLEVIYL